METKSIIMLALFLAVCMAFLVVRIVTACRCAKRYRRKHVVIARVKSEENGVWRCKFFLCGDHLGYFARKPSADRVKACIVDYDDKNRLFKLEEVSDDEDAFPLCKTWLV